MGYKVPTAEWSDAQPPWRPIEGATLALHGFRLPPLDISPYALEPDGGRRRRARGEYGAACRAEAVAGGPDRSLLLSLHAPDGDRAALLPQSDTFVVDCAAPPWLEGYRWPGPEDHPRTALTWLLFGVEASGEPPEESEPPRCLGVYVRLVFGAFCDGVRSEDTGLPASASEYSQATPTDIQNLGLGSHGIGSRFHLSFSAGADAVADTVNGIFDTHVSVVRAGGPRLFPHHRECEPLFFQASDDLRRALAFLRGERELTRLRPMADKGAKVGRNLALGSAARSCQRREDNLLLLGDFEDALAEADGNKQEALRAIARQVMTPVERDECDAKDDDGNPQMPSAEREKLVTKCAERARNRLRPLPEYHTLRHGSAGKSKA